MSGDVPRLVTAPGSDPRTPYEHTPRAEHHPGTHARRALKYGDRLAEAGIAASVGAVGDSFDNALAETINSLYKTELIKPRGPWKTADDVEIATAEWVDWFSHGRLYEYCGGVPPAELEIAYDPRISLTPAA